MFKALKAHVWACATCKDAAAGGCQLTTSCDVHTPTHAHWGASTPTPLHMRIGEQVHRKYTADTQAHRKLIHTVNKDGRRTTTENEGRQRIRKRKRKRERPNGNGKSCKDNAGAAIGERGSGVEGGIHSRRAWWADVERGDERCDDQRHVSAPPRPPDCSKCFNMSRSACKQSRVSRNRETLFKFKVLNLLCDIN